MEEISPNAETLNANTKIHSSVWNMEDKDCLDMN